MDALGLPDSQEVQDCRVQQASLELLDCLEHPDPKVGLGLQGPLVTLDRMENRVSPVPLDSRAPLASLDLRVLLEALERPDQLEHRDLPDSRVHKELLELLDRRVEQGSRVRADPLDHRALVDQRVLQDSLVLLVNPDRKDPQDSPDHKVRSVQQEVRVQAGLQDRLGRQDLRVPAVTRDLLVTQVRQVLLALKDRLDLQEPLGTQDSQDSRVR